MFTVSADCRQFLTVMFSITIALKGRALVIVDTATTETLMQVQGAHQAASHLPYTFPAIAGTHLPTLRGWRVG